MIRVAVIGAAGYTGGEVIRLLLLHPQVLLVCAQSESQKGKYIYEVHPDCFGLTTLQFSEELDVAVDVVFLCKGHGESLRYLKEHAIPDQTKVIDLSQDFRLAQTSFWGKKQFIYGLPECNRDVIRYAAYIANPGCFATAIQLSLLPVTAAGKLEADIHVSATTGSTGAGQALSSSSHFSWRSNNHSAYKVLSHQHVAEIMETIVALQGAFQNELHFIPQRGAFTRGIYSVLHFNTSLPLSELKQMYEMYYAGHPFTHVVPFEPDVKQVVNTNNCFLSVTKVQDRAVIIAVIDNLLKGAAGQAVQNMNLMFGIDERTGLLLKPSAF